MAIISTACTGSESPSWSWLRSTIVQKLGPLSNLVKLNVGRVWKRHVDHIKVLEKLKTTRPSVEKQWVPSFPVCQDETSPESPPKPASASASLAKPSVTSDPTVPLTYTPDGIHSRIGDLQTAILTCICILEKKRRCGGSDHTMTRP